MDETSSLVVLAAGSAAGFAVDLSLFPLDTVKTRLQSEKGFLRSGGFRGIYSGIGAAAVNSVPNAALFFVTYEFVKSTIKPSHSQGPHSPTNMIAASSGEIVACLVRVPSEVVKQRAQASPGTPTLAIFKNTIKSEGFAGLYRGYSSTVMREIPFSLIQFPLWEYLKSIVQKNNDGQVTPLQSAMCGTIAGSIAASTTTPLDVAKTRIMLANKNSAVAEGSIIHALSVVYRQNGIKGLFAGIGPRTLYISMGGAIYLGVYDAVKQWGTRLYTSTIS